MIRNINKLKNIILLLMCYLKFLFSGKSNIKIKKPRKIIVVQLAKLGDMVCTTPMFRAIKNSYPQCDVCVVGDGINQEILKNNSDVDDYIVYKENIFKTIARIRKIKADFACLTTPKFSILAVLYLASIKTIAVPIVRNGWCPFETRSYKLLRRIVIQVPHRMGLYAPREYLKLLEPVGIFVDDTAKHVHYSEKAEKNGLRFFQENNINLESDFIVGISPSAGNKIKNWGGHKFAMLADNIYQKYAARIIIFGGRRDKEEVTDMVGSINKNTKVINTLDMFGLDDLKFIISKLKVFISVDTGPIYIAEAFGVPTIDIIGPMDDKEQPPIGDIHRVVYVKDRNKPELHIMNASIYNKIEARRQIDGISVEMVVEELNKITVLKKYI